MVNVTSELLIKPTLTMALTEKLLHYIWQYQLFNKQHLKTQEEQSLQIIQPGQLNQNQGPDFLSAKIKIDQTLWVGSVEIHINSSDWITHQHSQDENYNNVVLHVVWRDDCKQKLPFATLEIQQLVPKLLLDKYKNLMLNPAFVACENSIAQTASIVIEKWKERLLVERLEQKAAYIDLLLKKSNGNWEELSWWVISRHFGGNVNGESFEQIAQSIPLTMLLKNRHSLFQIEAILFGQSGLLSTEFKDEYPKKLLQEYIYLKKKYQLRQPKVQLHFLRMRPANFPTIRIAQLSLFIHKNDMILSKIISTETIQDLKSLFEIEAKDYWHNHYRFDEYSILKLKKMGSQSINNLLINAIVVLLFAYGLYNHNQKLKDIAVKWLEDITPEENTITNGFGQLGIETQSAFDSQAFIQLKTKYCDEKKCLACAVGHYVIKPTDAELLQPMVCH